VSTIRVGCCGFTSSRREYFERLQTVEVQQTFYQPPKPSTARSWREEAPPAFELTMKAWQLITHEPQSPTYRRLAKPIPPELGSRYGSFRDTEEVWAAWETTRAVAEAMGAKVILFQSPASFTPTRENKERLRRFFTRLPRGAWRCAFEPRGVWEPEDVGALCRELDLLHAVDPLQEDPQASDRIAYFRLQGPVTGRYRYSDEDLSRIAQKCEPFELVYCLFNNVEMYKDALRFAHLLAMSEI
jgi:uncharacterized protein YecE (DUF72 family)